MHWAGCTPHSYANYVSQRVRITLRAIPAPTYVSDNFKGPELPMAVYTSVQLVLPPLFLPGVEYGVYRRFPF